MRIAPAEAPGGNTTPPPMPPPPVSVGGTVVSETWLFEGAEHPTPEGNATASLRVTRPDEVTFRWTYTVTNNTMSTLFASTGLSRFNLAGADTSGVHNLFSSLGWPGTASGGAIDWTAPSPASGPFVAKGVSATFSFDTPPVPVAPGYGYVRTADERHSTNDPEGELTDYYTRIGTAETVREEVKVPGVPLTAKLESVKFTSGPSGTTSFWIDADPNDAPYIREFHWLDKDLDGLINHAGDRQLPVGFVGGSAMYVEARLKTTGSTPPGMVFVKADGPGDFDMDWTQCPVVNGYIEVPKTKLKAKLPDKVDYVKEFSFKGTIEPMDQPVTSDAGTSTNELFVTLATPRPLRLSYISGGQWTITKTDYTDPNAGFAIFTDIVPW